MTLSCLRVPTEVTPPCVFTVTCSRFVLEACAPVVCPHFSLDLGLVHDSR